MQRETKEESYLTERIANAMKELSDVSGDFGAFRERPSEQEYKNKRSRRKIAKKSKRNNRRK